MTWLIDNHWVAVNMDSAARMRDRYVQSTVIGNHFTVEVIDAAGGAHQIGMYEEQSEARDWISQFVSNHP